MDLLIFLYLYSIVLILEMITTTITIISVGRQCCDAFILTLGSSRDYVSVCLTLCMSIFLSVCSSMSIFVDHSRGP